MASLLSIALLTEVLCRSSYRKRKVRSPALIRIVGLRKEQVTLPIVHQYAIFEVAYIVPLLGVYFGLAFAPHIIPHQ